MGLTKEKSMVECSSMFGKSLKIIILLLVIFAFSVTRAYAATSGMIVGRTFIDENLDGRFQFGEQGIAGIEITLTNLTTLKTKKVASFPPNGIYEIYNVPFGTYNISITQKPLGHRNTTSRSMNFNFNQELKGIDFGFFPSTATVKGTVFHDTNKNGTREANETGVVSGARVTLGNIERITGMQGLYTIVFVKPGTWELKVLSPAPYSVTTKNLKIEVPVGFEGTITKNVGIAKI